jgi:alpha-L-fucosidase 2
MKRIRFLASMLFLSALVAPHVCRAQDATMSSDYLWYKQPAIKWTDALPIGNGRIGAMIFGGVPDERIQFNEDTLWQGQPHDYARPSAREHLPEIRKLLFDGNAKQAGEVARQTFLGDPSRQKAYQPFGDLRIHFTGLTNVTDYRRDLNLDSAVASTTYRANGVLYQRQAFASYPDQVIVLRFTADQPGAISFTLKMDSPQRIRRPEPSCRTRWP